MTQRAPFQILVMPFKLRDGADPEFAALRRRDLGVWQGFAGGGESGESPDQAARRETHEEGGLPRTMRIYALDAHATIPTSHFSAAAKWGPEVFVILEHAFAVDCTAATIRLSSEHTAIRWGDYSTIHALLEWDSNRTALWELSERLRNDQLAGRLIPAG